MLQAFRSVVKLFWQICSDLRSRVGGERRCDGIRLFQDRWRRIPSVSGVPAFLSESGFLGLEGDSGDSVAALSGDCAGLRWWLFGVHLPLPSPWPSPAQRERGCVLS